MRFSWLLPAPASLQWGWVKQRETKQVNQARSKAGWLGLSTFMLAALPGGVAAEAERRVEEIEALEVIGVTPLHGSGLPVSQIPTNVQEATAADIARTQAFDLTEFMNRNLGGVTVNAVQNNPLQPDVQYRGFTASPLLGLPQGIAVFVDGVRVNEVFGDTVNWDLIPEAAIASVNLIGGADPVFGLNTLGGALSIQTKNGFTNPGTTLELAGGSFGRFTTTLQSGGHLGAWGYHLTADYFTEDGWREFSASQAASLLGTLSWRGAASTLDLHLTHANTKLRGNGASPAELLAADRSAVFTAPDITQNNLNSASLQGSHWLGDETLLSANIFGRANQAQSFNGDTTSYEACPGMPGMLCDEDGVPLADEAGNPVSSSFDAINSASVRRQRSFGGTTQLTLMQPLFGRRNHFVAGIDYLHGLVDFDAGARAAVLDAQRSTTSLSPGPWIPDAATSVKARSRTAGMYLTDTFSLTDRLSLSLSARYNATRVVIADASGTAPELNGSHDFERLNPAAGLTYQWSRALNLYGGYSESTRAPTPVELTCASEDAPCRLPNDFISDPPLKQVVAKSWEAGARGTVRVPWAGQDSLHWHLGLFRTVNVDDILFQSTGGATANQGFFSNVGKTRRQGIELGLKGSTLAERLRWSLHYTYLEATFRTPFVESSPHHPAADANGDIAISRGDQIPGLPAHNLKLGLDWAVTPSLSLGGDLLYNSGQYLRGDEANLLDTVDGYATVNLRGEYRFSRRLSAFVSIENLFDSDYESFGVLGDPTEVFPGYSDPRFFGAGAPRAVWLGVRLSL